MAFDEEFGKTPWASVVQLFSFQRDRIKKLAVPNWLNGLVRSRIPWHFSMSDQQPFHSMIHAIASMTFKETQGLFLWFEEVILDRASALLQKLHALSMLLVSSTSAKLHLTWSFVEWWAEWICNYHDHLCSSPRAGLGDHLIPVSTSQAATFALSLLALLSPFPAHSSFLSKPPPKGLGVSVHPHLHCVLSHCLSPRCWVRSREKENAVITPADGSRSLPKKRKYFCWNISDSSLHFCIKQ